MLKLRERIVRGGKFMLDKKTGTVTVEIGCSKIRLTKAIIRQLYVFMSAEYRDTG